VLPDGSTGYWAAKGDGTYYYFGPDGVLYNDDYAGEVQSGDVQANMIGNVATYDFVAAGGTTGENSSYTGAGYGGIYV
jgi:hypothetical protein